MSTYHQMNHYRIQDLFVDFLTDNMGSETGHETPAGVIERIIEASTCDDALRNMLKQIASMYNLEEAIADLIYPSEVEVEVVYERVVRTHSYVTLTFDDKDEYENYKSDPQTYVIDNYMYDVEANEHHRDESEEAFEVEEL